MTPAAGDDNFNRNLADALARSRPPAGRGSTPPAAPPTPPAPAGDGFQQRLQQQLQTTGAAGGGSAAPAGPVWDFRLLASGETLQTIAAEGNATAEEIWNHPKNEGLRTDRTQESITAGDRVYAPLERVEDPSTGPVGQGDYLVKDGDCMSKIANKTGFFWQTLWDDPGNATLQEIRVDPNTLLEGDRVTIPEKQRKEESIEPEMRHRFVRLGEPATLNAKLQVADQPLANKPYKVFIDRKKVAEETTSGDGSICPVPLPGDAREALVVVDPETEPLAFRFRLGSVPPITEAVGIARRLVNLGFLRAPSEKLDLPLIRAIKEFQEANGLPANGNPDETMRDKLKEVHGS